MRIKTPDLLKMGQLSTNSRAGLQPHHPGNSPEHIWPQDIRFSIFLAWFYYSHSLCHVNPYLTYFDGLTVPALSLIYFRTRFIHGDKSPLDYEKKHVKLCA